MILDRHDEARAQFVERFDAEIDGVAAALVGAFAGYRSVDEQIQGDMRVASVAAFLFSSLNALVTSSQLLVSGMLIPSGNMMRQYAEASAMAILCSSPRLDVYDRFERNPRQFPVHTSLDLLNRRAARRVIPLEPSAWERFTQLTRFYDRFSHPSSLAVASLMMFETDSLLSLGGEFDVAKIDQYRIELIRRRSAAEVLTEVADYLVEAARTLRAQISAL